jgi:hypothetical protein
MIVYIVGDNGPEHNTVRSIHKTQEGALKAWNQLRIELLEKAKKFLKLDDKSGKEMWQRIIDNLSCEDPEKIDNYPQDTPYIRKYEVEG